MVLLTKYFLSITLCLLNNNRSNDVSGQKEKGAKSIAPFFFIRKLTWGQSTKTLLSAAQGTQKSFFIPGIIPDTFTDRVWFKADFAVRAGAAVHKFSPYFVYTIIIGIFATEI